MDFNVNSMLETWKTAVLKPNDFFASAKKSASFTQGAVWIAIASIAATIIQFILASLLGLRTGLKLTPSLSGLPLSLISNAIFALIATAIIAGIFWILAHLLGGSGGFRNQYYAGAGFHAPLVILGAIIAFIPGVGSLAGLALLLFQLYLLWTMIKVIHGLSSGKAAAVVLIPVIILAIVFVVAAALLVSLFGLTGMSGLGGA